MGAGQSSAAGSIANPFPVDPRLSKDLDKLSIVAARILSTPDIYDVNNLSRPGVCGDYAVFLRKNLEKKLLPFVFDDAGKRTEVVYQNPRKSMENQELRKKICRSMIDTMLRTISTVVASLASIQVASPSRETAITGIGVQKGGGIPDIREWLENAGYISRDNKSTAGNQVPFHNPGLPKSSDYEYYLTLDRTEAPLTYAYITAKTLSTAGASFQALPTGALRVHFLNPIQIPVAGSAAHSILPIRIVDNANIPWCAGVLYQNVFKSFNTTSPQFYITDLIIRLFRRTQGSNDEITETRNDINIANNVFQEYRRTMISKYIFDAIPQFLSQHIPGYQSYAPGTIQQPQYIQGPGGILQQVIPGVATGVGPTAPQQAMWRPPTSTVAGAPQVALRPVTTQVIPGVTDFDIPSSSAKSIGDTLKLFRSAVSVESSPAAVRATTLAALENRDRTVQTGICTDKYWTMPNLARVYPWSTLQFLSVRDWSALSEDRSKTQFEPEWDNFLSKLSSLYNGTGSNPKLERPGETKFLDQMRITNVANLAICKQSQNPRVAFQEVQAGIQELQALYRDHVRKMWGILNSLILVIVDPETQQEVVRLHPNVVAGASSADYVNERAKEARSAIAEYYIAVEKAYLTAGSNLRLV
jgi:hypothetical protein